MMDNANVIKRPVMGNRARKCVLQLAVLAALAALAVGFLIWKLPGHRTTLLVVLACAWALLIALCAILPRAVYYSAYTYSLSGEGITLWRRSEAVMSLAWTETEVSLGSYILRGNENNPGVCEKAICFTRKGEMRKPPRFPKRALKGAAGELCVAYSKARLREVFLACGGNVSGEVTPDGLRLSASDTQQMLDTLNRTREWAKKKAANDAAKAAAEASRLAHEEARAAERSARQAQRETIQSHWDARREKERRETAPEAEPVEAQEEEAGVLSAPAQEREAPAVRGPSVDLDSLGDDEDFL